MLMAVPPAELAAAWEQTGLGDPQLWLAEHTGSVANATQAALLALAIALILAFLLGWFSATAVITGQSMDTSWLDRDEKGLRELVLRLGLTDDMDRVVKAAQVRIAKEVRARVAKIGPVLAAGTEQQLTRDELAAAITAALEYAVWAEVTTTTEIIRVQADAAAVAYRQAGVTRLEWLDAGDERVCSTCHGNAAAEPVPFGQPFPSGHVAPPGHPRCRCALGPA